jgi:zinc D-Ala-D-Ala dipeptidase
MQPLQILVPLTVCLGLLGTTSMGCKKDSPVLLPRTPVTKPVKQTIPAVDYDTLLWKEIKTEDGFVIDIKYATTDNFVKEVIYPCGRMFLRPVVANALFKIRDELLSEKYKLKLFDGYRPRPAQQKLWDKVPNPDYVAPPSEGSMHNRGVAIDLTLTDINGKEIDMGTPYDFFGPAAHHDYLRLSPEILALRLKLKTIMESHGFQSIRTEWWHYSYTKGKYPLDDWQWRCPD